MDRSDMDPPAKRHKPITHVCSFVRYDATVFCPTCGRVASITASIEIPNGQARLMPTATSDEDGKTLFVGFRPSVKNRRRLIARPRRPRNELVRIERWDDKEDSIMSDLEPVFKSSIIVFPVAVSTSSTQSNIRVDHRDVNRNTNNNINNNVSISSSSSSSSSSNHNNATTTTVRASPYALMLDDMPDESEAGIVCFTPASIASGSSAVSSPSATKTTTSGTLLSFSNSSMRRSTTESTPRKRRYESSMIAFPLVTMTRSSTFDSAHTSSATMATKPATSVPRCNRLLPNGTFCQEPLPSQDKLDAMLQVNGVVTCLGVSCGRTIVEARMVDNTSGRDQRPDGAHAGSNPLSLGRTARYQSETIHRLPLMNASVMRQLGSSEPVATSVSSWSACSPFQPLSLEVVEKALNRQHSAPEASDTTTTTATTTTTTTTTTPAVSAPGGTAFPPNASSRDRFGEASAAALVALMPQLSINTATALRLGAANGLTNKDASISFTSASASAAAASVSIASSTSPALATPFLPERTRQKAAIKSKATLEVTGAATENQLPFEVRRAFEAFKVDVSTIINMMYLTEEQRRHIEAEIDVQARATYAKIAQNDNKGRVPVMHTIGLLVYAALLNGVPCVYRLFPAGQRDVISNSLRRILEKLDDSTHHKSHLPNFEIAKAMIRMIIYRRPPWFDISKALEMKGWSSDECWNEAQKWLRLLLISGLFGHLSSSEINKDAHTNPLEMARRIDAAAVPKCKRQRATVHNLSKYLSTATQGVCIVFCLMQTHVFSFVPPGHPSAPTYAFQEPNVEHPSITPNSYAAQAIAAAAAAAASGSNAAASNAAVSKALESFQHRPVPSSSSFAVAPLPPRTPKTPAQKVQRPIWMRAMREESEDEDEENEENAVVDAATPASSVPSPQFSAAAAATTTNDEQDDNDEDEEETLGGIYSKRSSVSSTPKTPAATTRMLKPHVLIHAPLPSGGTLRERKKRAAIANAAAISPKAAPMTITDVSTNAAAAAAAVAADATATTAPNETTGRRKRRNTPRQKLLPVLPLRDLFYVCDATASTIQSRLNDLYDLCHVVNCRDIPDGQRVLGIHRRAQLVDIQLPPSNEAIEASRTPLSSYLTSITNFLQSKWITSSIYLSWQLRNYHKDPSHTSEQQAFYRDMRHQVRIKTGLTPMPTSPETNNTTGRRGRKHHTATAAAATTSRGGSRNKRHRRNNDSHQTTAMIESDNDDDDATSAGMAAPTRSLLTQMTRLERPQLE
jgi:hypothetical protein